MTDHVFPDLEQEKEKLAAAGAELVYINSRDDDEITKAVADADAVITCYANISARAIKGMTKCKSISKTGIGVNNIDVAQATAQGIKVLNVPDYCIEEVSDATVALALSLTRRIPFLWDNVRGGKWSLEGSKGISRMRGKIFGFLGFGAIARMAAEKVRPYGVKLIAYDPYIKEEVAQKLDVTLMSLEDVIRQSDILSLNLPLTEETNGMINSKTLGMMKPTALLVNTSRGPLVNEADLCEALKSGKIAGAGLDVICDEANAAENPLYNAPNVIVTPHAAYYSVESTQELRDKVMDGVLAALAGTEPKYQVNR